MKQYTQIKQVPEDIFKEHVKNATSTHNVLRSLGFSGAGAAYPSVRKRIKELGLDTSHFIEGQQLRCQKITNTLDDVLSKILVCNSTQAGNHIRKYILKFNLVEYVCSMCHNTGSHNGKPLTLQLDHINGDSQDHRLENLRFLCPNCHTQTPTYGTIKRKNAKFCPGCGKKILKNSLACRSCRPDRPKKINWPTPEEMKKLVWEMPITKVVKILGVNHTSIRNFCSKNRIDRPPQGYFLKKENISHN